MFINKLNLLYDWDRLISWLTEGACEKVKKENIALCIAAIHLCVSVHAYVSQHLQLCVWALSERHTMTLYTSTMQLLQ